MRAEETSKRELGAPSCSRPVSAPFDTSAPAAGQGESYFTAMEAEKTQQILYALMNGELRVILDGGDRDLWGLADLGSPVVVWPLPQAYKMVSTT